MNYLAHLYLSGSSEELIVGNFIADAVRSSQVNNYTDKVKRGIELHRIIDSYTDTHPVVNKSKERLRKNYHKYSTVIVDIFYDHFLARNWSDHSEIPLNEYSSEIYRILHNNEHLLNGKAKMFYSYMVKNNILNAYKDMSGIQRVLTGMSKRAKFISNMEKATFELETYYDFFEEEFKAFFPELKKHVSSEIKQSH
jgi:acyl carrier protein phosphodiesterase